MTTSGIGIIKNIASGKIFAFKSFNLEKQWEIYQNQLNLNIHHNIRLQKDWNSSGNENFEFDIIEEIDDEFFLDDGFVNYVNHLDYSYNSFLIDEFIFRYDGESTLLTLYELMGKDNCSPQFLKKLENNDLSIDDYDEIKNEMISLIKFELIAADEIENKLNEIVHEKSRNVRIHNLDMQYKLINDLEDFCGIFELTDDFKLKLNSENLPEEVGFEIKNQIMELIFSDNVLDNDINKQIDSYIEIFKQKVSEEIIEKLTVKADNLKDNNEFMNHLHDSNLIFDDALKIIEQLKKLINAGIITEDNFSEKLDELIDIEIENKWIQTKNDLKNNFNQIIISKKVTDKLERYNLTELTLPKLLSYINESIESKEIKSVEELDEKINSFIDVEIDKLNYLKEELLAYLDVTYGSEYLSSQFKSQLNDAQLSIEYGNEIITILTQDISLFKIKSTDQIDESVNKLIFDKNKLILQNQLYDLVGKDKNNSAFSQKLKFNYLTEEDGNIIRNDFCTLIDSHYELKNLLELRNSLENKLNEIVKDHGLINKNKLIDLSNDLKDSLKEIIGDKPIKDSFKQELYSNNLGEECWQTINDEIIELIQYDELQPNFEMTINKLQSLKDNGIDVVIEEIIQRESIKRAEEYKLLKTQLISEVNELIGLKENTAYYNELLNENQLNYSADSNIRHDFKRILESDEICDQDNFNYKYEELLSVKQKTIKTLLEELIQKQKTIYIKMLTDLRKRLLSDLYRIIGKDVVKNSFRDRLYSNQLNLDYAETFKKSIEGLINSDEICDNQFKFKLEELLDLKDKSVDYKLNELIIIESDKVFDELNNLKKELTLDLNRLTSDISYSDKLKDNNLNSKAGNEIKQEINNIIISSEVINPKFNYKFEELTYLKKKTVRLYIDELIGEYAAINDKNLTDTRKKLYDNIDGIIGKNNVNVSFKHKLESYDLEEDFALEIKQQLIDFIGSDEVSSEKFEIKLDELNDLDNNAIQSKIDEIIDDEVERRKLLLKEKLLNELYDITGRGELSEKFVAKLNAANFDEELGIEIKQHFESKIDSLSIGDGFDFEKSIDDMIHDKNKNILLNQTYEIIGRESNSDYFTNKLKTNMITTQTGENIRLELLSMVNGSDLKSSVELRNITMKNIFDEIIFRESKLRNNKLKELRNNLLRDLNSYTSKHSFKKELSSKNLNSEHLDKIKDEIRDFINLDEIEGDFEFKVDELNDLSYKGIETKINEIIEREVNKIEDELQGLRKELTEDFNEYILPYNQFSFSTKELNKRNLTKSTGLLANNEIKNIINSDDIKNPKFATKLDELKDLKKDTVKTKFIEIIERYSKHQKELIEFLHFYTIDDKSFNQKLNALNLFDDSVDDFVNDVENKIKNNEYDKKSDITKAIDYYVNEAVEQDKALSVLYDKVGRKGISFKFRARLMLNRLSSEEGELISQNIENKIKNEGLRANKVENEIQNQINLFSKRHSNSSSKVQRKHVYCSQCGYKNLSSSNFCEHCGEKLE